MMGLRVGTQFVLMWPPRLLLWVGTLLVLVVMRVLVLVMVHILPWALVVLSQ